MIDVYLPGEQEAITILVKIGAVYGYGNCIYRLKEAWIKYLVEEYNIPEEQAKLAVDI